MGMLGDKAKKGTSISRNQGMGAEAPKATNHLHPPWERRASSTRTSIMDEAGQPHAPGRVRMQRPKAAESEERNKQELCRQAGGPEDQIKESIRVTCIWRIVLVMGLFGQPMSLIFTELIPRDLAIRLRPRALRHGPLRAPNRPITHHRIYPRFPVLWELRINLCFFFSAPLGFLL